MEMLTRDLELSRQELQKLLAYGSGDAALLFLYLRCGNEAGEAAGALGLTDSRAAEAKAALIQLGLWREENVRVLREERRPEYTEQEVIQAQRGDQSFRELVGEIQRNLGRTLNTEELKTILSFLRYLGLPGEVVSLLICYCRERNRRRGNPRNPSMRMIEKEAYAWADQGIDTLEAAVAFVRDESIRSGRVEKVKELLQIRDRSLTPGEEKYARSWVDMGFDQEALTMAYEKTCVNTGGLKWPYMNKILLNWHSQGLHTGSQIRGGDKGPGAKGGPRQLDQEEIEAIKRLMREPE